MITSENVHGVADGPGCPMKLLVSFLLLSIAAFAQNQPDAKIFTFSRTDSAHCRVIAVAGKPMLESTYGGISVAVGMPENKGNGEFSVYVSIYAGGGTVRVVPKEFSATFSDSDHTRFPFFDKAAETKSLAPARAPESGMSAETNQIDTSQMRGGPSPAPAAGLSPSGTLKGDNLPANIDQAPAADLPADPRVYLEPAKVKQGSKAAGLVYFRKPKGSKIQVNPADMLDEIDIRLNGIVFRF
jgi:hypothetical protein